MPSFHIPERLDSTSLLRGKACFIPDSYRRENTYHRSSRDILDTFEFRVVGQVVADSQLYGSSAAQVNVINYTDSNIVSLDKWNRVNIIPPCLNDANGKRLHDGAIFIEIVNSKALQSADLGARIYKRYRSLNVLHKGEIGSYFYKDPNHEEAPKWQGNQIHQFSIGEAIEQLNDLGGSFYCPNSDLVFMTMEAAETGELVLHPNTDVATLAELGIEEECCRVITHQISVNNMRSKEAWVNIAGDVVNLPNSRDPNKPTGVFIRRLENRRGVKIREIISEYFAFDDPNCPLNIFDSETAAITNGHPDKAVELEIVKTKLLTEKAKSDNARENQDFQQKKIENDKIIEDERLKTEAAQAKAARDAADAQAKARAAQAKVDEEKAEHARKENKQTHRSRMLEIAGKIALAVAGIVTAGLSIYRLKKI